MCVCVCVYLFSRVRAGLYRFWKQQIYDLAFRLAKSTPKFIFAVFLYKDQRFANIFLRYTDLMEKGMLTHVSLSAFSYIS